MPIVALDHVQLAMPPDGEELARAFYRGLLGLPEVPKPEALRARGGCWFENGSLKVHLGVEQDFRPARKAHPAFLVRELSELIACLQNAGYQVQAPDVENTCRVFVFDPFGNRLELIEQTP